MTNLNFKIQKTLKSNIMASAVAGFQFLSPQWRDMDNEKT